MYYDCLNCHQWDLIVRANNCIYRSHLYFYTLRQQKEGMTTIIHSFFNKKANFWSIDSLSQGTSMIWEWETFEKQTSHVIGVDHNQTQ